MNTSEIESFFAEFGIYSLHLIEVTHKPDIFCEVLSRGRKSQRFGGLVNAHVPTDFLDTDTRLFLSENAAKGCRGCPICIGCAGCAVEADGNITAVFKHSTRRGDNVPDELLIFALLQGGCKLDCYAGDIDGGTTYKEKLSYLPSLYERYGFEPVARVLFNAEFAEPEFLEKYGGKRDIIVYLHNGDSVSQTITKLKNSSYRRFTIEEYMSLPVMEYESARAFRDELLQNRIENMPSSLK